MKAKFLLDALAEMGQTLDLAKVEVKGLDLEGNLLELEGVKFNASVPAIVIATDAEGPNDL